MKTIASILLCLVLAACVIEPIPDPAPPPAPVTVGSYTIREYDVNGNVINAYQGVTMFRETRFPRSVAFTHNGLTITLSGSYQISRSLK